MKAFSLLVVSQASRLSQYHIKGEVQSQSPLQRETYGQDVDIKFKFCK